MALEDFRSRFGKAFMELTGTFILVLTIQTCGQLLPPLGAAAIALALIASIYAGFPISGAHYNPAISFTIFLRGKLDAHTLFVYTLFQVAGGFLGALVGAIISGSRFAPALGPHSNLLQAFLAEFVFTTLLCFVVLATATNSKVDGNMYYGLAIGFVIFGGALAVGNVSGAAFNPAVVVGLVVVKHLFRLGYAAWLVLAQLAGAMGGAALFYIVAPDEFEHFGDRANELLDEARNLLPDRNQTSNA